MSKKILIVEDDMNILQLEKDYLEANGFEVETTTDGARGLSLRSTETTILLCLI